MNENTYMGNHERSFMLDARSGHIRFSSGNQQPKSRIRRGSGGYHGDSRCRGVRRHKASTSRKQIIKWTNKHLIKIIWTGLIAVYFVASILIWR